MARHKSAQKRARQTVKRTARNSSIEHRVRQKVRVFREAAGAGEKTKAAEALKVATREVQAAVSKGVLHYRTASRRVSRLTLTYNKIAE